MTHNVTALLVEPGNAQELGLIMRLAEWRALRKALGASARQAAIERHTWTRNAHKIVNAYTAWLEEAPAGTKKIAI